MTIARLYFWHLSPGNAAARDAIKEALYRAFCRSRTGQRILAALKKAQAARTALRAIRENQSYQARDDAGWHLFMRMQQADLLEGRGTDEHLSLLHSWMGHMLFIALQRIKRLPRGTVAYLELRQNTLPLLCRGRRALVNAWLRYEQSQRAGFSGLELHAFKAGFDEAVLVSLHASRREVRAAFDFADHTAKAKGLKVIKSNYQY